MDNLDKKNHQLKTKIADPKWIFLTLSIPQFILLIILFDNYSIVKSQLSKYDNLVCRLFGLTLLILAVLYSIYAIIRIFQNQKVHRILPVVIITTYITHLYIFCLLFKNFSFNMPSWIIPIDDILLYYGTFTIPVLFYALFLGERIISDIFKAKRIWINLLFVLLIPTVWFFFFKFIEIIENHYLDIHYNFTLHRIFYHVTIFASIIFTLCFYFFLLRGLLSLYKKKYDSLKKLNLLWTILFALILPLFGLLLNECYFPFSFLNSSNFRIENFHFIFGDFSNILFFILAICNGIILSLPPLNNKLYRTGLFISRAVLLIFTLYFFIVFIPFMPFFIFSIIVFGLGFLLITPLILLMIHFKILNDDIKYLSGFIQKKKVILIALLSMVLIPVIMSTFFIIEKHNLYKAMNYVYHPNFQKKNSPNINIKLLDKTLNKIIKIKKDNNSFDNRGIPFITQFYNRIVLNNLTLSEDKINFLSRIFLNNKTSDIISNNDSIETSKNVIIKNINYKTEYDFNTNLYHTFIDLELKNEVELNSEFITYIDVPDGVWVNDYYLYVNGIKKKAFLAEKKSVLWTYQMVLSERRDPGIMYYVNGNKIALRVFPFLENETRKSGFELIHLEPIIVKNNDKNIFLEIKPVLTSLVFSNNNSTVYIPQKIKNNLKKIKRTPYYHFIIDCSGNSIESKNKYLESINRLLEKNMISSNNIKFTLTGYSTETYGFNDQINNRLLNYKNKGGFYLDRALKEILFNNFSRQEPLFPVIVVVTDNISDVIFNNEISNLLFTLPDTNLFYRLTNGGNLIKYDLNDFDPYDGTLIDVIDQKNVYEFDLGKNKIYLNDGKNSCLIFDNKNNLKNFSFNENISNNLLSLAGLVKWDLLHAESGEKNWKNIYYNSISMKTLSFYTSFVVLENEAQEKKLLKKQEEVLNSKKFLDAGENMKEEMPEPSLLIICFPVIIIYLIKKSRKIYFR